MAKADIPEVLKVSVPPQERVILADRDPGDTFGVKEKAAIKGAAKIQPWLFERQMRLWAEKQRSLLVVVQGMDTSGKDGLVKHVMTGLNPAGVLVHGFKAPTPAEKRHHFLWRFKNVLPEPGTISIFNRSYYEDVLVGRVKQLASEATIARRYGEINRFEAELQERGVQLVKLMLHISYEEQRRRLADRLMEADKHWKFSENDVHERPHWDEYMVAFDLALTRCSSVAPWYVIPADNKWFRDYAVSKILKRVFKQMDPQYPRVRLPVKRLMRELEAGPYPAA